MLQTRRKFRKVIIPTEKCSPSVTQHQVHVFINYRHVISNGSFISVDVVINYVSKIVQFERTFLKYLLCVLTKNSLLYQRLSTDMHTRGLSDVLITYSRRVGLINITFLCTRWFFIVISVSVKSLLREAVRRQQFLTRLWLSK